MKSATPSDIPRLRAENKAPAGAGFFGAYLLPLGLLAALVVLVYSNTLSNGFHLDDYYMIVKNPGITRVQPLGRHFLDPGTMSSLKSLQQYRPLLPLTLSLNYAVSGLAPATYHLFNIAVHYVAVVFFYLFFLTLLENWGQGWSAGTATKWTAFGAAAIFAVHPISGFPVNYLCARDLLMMQAAQAGSLYCYVRMRRVGETPLRWAVTLGLFVLSLLSKPNAAMAVIVVFLFETLVAREKVLSKELWLRVLPFVLMVVLFQGFTRFILGFSDLDQALADPGSSFGYLLTQVKLHLFHYLRNLVWPFEIRGLPYVKQVKSVLDPQMLVALAFIGATIAVAWLVRRRAPVMAFAIFAYWATMLPESSFLPLHRIAADYRAYPGLPYLGLVIAMLAFRYLPPKAAPMFLAALLVYFGASAYAMNRHYRDDKSFWAQSVRYGGDETATMNYALCFRGQDEGIAKTYLEKALQINPYYYFGNINLGLFYIDHGEKEKGLALVKQGVSYSPRICLDHSLYWLAVAYEKVGDLKGAHDAIVGALGYNPNDIDYLYEAAFIAQALAQYEEALRYLGAIHQREPNIKISRFIAGWCHQVLGRHDQAVAEYLLAIKYRPDYPQTYVNLGYALISLGRSRDACGYFEKFLELEPGNQGVRKALEACRQSGSK
jgi:tetratricopeptide (TPR) repeat protein